MYAFAQSKVHKVLTLALCLYDSKIAWEEISNLPIHNDENKEQLVVYFLDADR